ncbi:MAG: protein phosphatase 2C domain-containing protein [candidate division SR1 bacterium]|nr:protein phosphatase 2C domain-containing protein [candidate division SR1 bacterium]
MKNLDQFEIAGASVLGTRHLKIGRNNQDSFVWIKTPDYIISIVSDGCSSGLHSEVGSKIMAPLFAQTLATYLSKPHPSLSDENFFRHDWLWYNVRQDVLARVRVLAQSMDENLIATICKYFLCTIVGCVITPQSTCIFSCGDGVFYLNGNMHVMGPFPGNKPPYLCYGITGSEVTNSQPSLLDIQRHVICSTDEVQSILIGSDGVSDLTTLADQKLPGREERIGDISQFWTEDIYFKNPEWIRNVLTTINTEKRKPVWEEKTILKYQGLLPDDTTFVVLRNQQKNIGLGKPFI